MRYEVRLIDEDSSNKIRINCESEGRVGRFKFSEGLIAKTRRVSRQRTRSHTEIRVDKREAATPADDDELPRRRVLLADSRQLWTAIVLER